MYWYYIEIVGIAIYRYIGVLSQLYYVASYLAECRGPGRLRSRWWSTWNSCVDPDRCYWALVQSPPARSPHIGAPSCQHWLPAGHLAWIAHWSQITGRKETNVGLYMGTKFKMLSHVSRLLPSCMLHTVHTLLASFVQYSAKAGGMYFSIA